jgi:Phage capsid family
MLKFDQVDRHLDLGRYALALLRGGGSLLASVDAAIAAGWRGGPIETVLRSAVAAGTTSDPAWATNLAEHRQLIAAFVGTLQTISLVDALAPVAVGAQLDYGNIAVVTATAVGDVVAQGKPTPIHRFTIGSAAMSPKKIAATIVASRELLRMAADAAVQLLHAELRRGVAAASNSALLADLTAGLSPIASVQDFGTDLAEAVATMNLDATSRLFVAVPPALLARLALSKATAGGPPEYPNLTVAGGTVGGMTVLPVATHTDTGGSDVVVIDAAQIAIARGPVVLDLAEEANVQLSDTPDDPATASTVPVSLWEQNLIAIRAQRFAGWQRLRTSAIALIDGAHYGAP